MEILDFFNQSYKPCKRGNDVMRLDMSGLDDRSGPLAENDPALDPAHRLMAAVSQSPIAFRILRQPLQANFRQ